MFWAYEAGGAFAYRHGGRIHKIPAAVGVHHEALRELLNDVGKFASWARLDGTLPVGVVAELRDGWCLHQGLPIDPDEVEHLLAMLSTYGPELEVDLRAVGVDLVEEFRARRWRLLANAINRLPYAAHFREKMLNDPETAERIMATQAKQDPGAKKNGIPVSEYTQQVSLLRDVITTLRGVQAATIAAAGGKPGTVEAYPGPITMLKAAEASMRQAQHEELVARVLPGKRRPSGG